MEAIVVNDEIEKLILDGANEDAILKVAQRMVLSR